MPWTPRAKSRGASYGSDMRAIDLNLEQIQKQVMAGIFEGLDKTGQLALAHAKKNAPVRKVFHGEREQGGGRTKGMRTLTDLEVAAEAEDRKRLRLGPGRGVRTLGRPGTHPGRPRAPRSYQVDPYFGQVGMPNSEAPYNPNFLFRQQRRPEEKRQALDAHRYADRVAKAMEDRMRADKPSERYEARRYKYLIRNQREVSQTDISKARGGHVIRPEEHAAQPTRRIVRANGQRYTETTGSLRVREQREGLPYGAHGRYDMSVADISDAMTGRGKYEAGISMSRGASQAGRAVILNPETGRLQVGGRLKHAITRTPVQLDGGVMTTFVDSPTYYTRYVEYGTRHAHAQPFLRPAVGHVRNQMRDQIRRAIVSKLRGRP